MSERRSSTRKTKGVPPRRLGEDEFSGQKSSSCTTLHGFKDDENHFQMQHEANQAIDDTHTNNDDSADYTDDDTLVEKEKRVATHPSVDSSLKNDEHVDSVRERQQICSQINGNEKLQRIEQWRKATMEHEDDGASICSSKQSQIDQLAKDVQKLSEELSRYKNQEISVQKSKNKDPEEKCEAGIPMKNDIRHSGDDNTKHSYMEMMSTFMARQNKMDLPKFGGDPEDWPLFHSEYHRTTAIGRFSSVENVTRLRTSLKDDALDSVKSLLISPDSADKIMHILERRFGRPEYIIKSLITKTKNILPPKEDKPMTIVKFATAVENLTGIIELLKRPEYLCNPQLIFELESKLPPTLHIMWSDFIYDKTTYNLRDFADWLDRKSHAASLRIQPELTPVTSKGESRRTGRVNTATTKKTESIKCKVCSSTCKSLANCKQFLEMSVDERWKIVTMASLCFSCLFGNHTITTCRKKVTCNIDSCKKHHHHLLHSNRNSPEDNKSIELCAHSSSNEVATNLRILPIYIRNGDIEIKTLAMLDPGATMTLIRSDIADQLQIKGFSSPLTVKWFNGDSAEELDSRCFSIHIKGTFHGAKTYRLRDVRSVKKMPLVCQSVDKEALSHKWPYLRNLDFESYKNGQPTILIGENNGLLTSTRQLIHDKWNSPIASKTWLGWTISGNDGAVRRSEKTFSANFITNSNDDELHDMVKSFWTLDNTATSKIDIEKSRDDDRAIQILENTTKRIATNRWESGLLWKLDNIPLPKESRTMAHKRLLLLEKRLNKDDSLSCSYQSIFNDYIQKGYLREVNIPKNPNDRQWYLPHFPVINANKPGKVRMVFDAAAKCKGVALNDMLLQGPDQLKSLPGVIFRFRQGAIGFTADIKEMFHRVQIRDDDCYSQLVLWRGCKQDDEPKTFKMTAMTFGATCSPCTAIFVKDRNADEFNDEYPEAVNAIKRNHYMDDYLGTARNIEEAVQLISDVINIHAHGGFELRNWCATSATILNCIPSYLLPIDKKEQINFNKCSQLSRVLGISWDTKEDVFTFTTNFSKIDSTLLNGERTPTKREALKIIMSVFDPIGFIAHFIIVGKIILQKIWKTGLDWDDELTADLNVEWKDWLINLQQISCVKIPRCYSEDFLDARCVELHCFVDASDEAYSAVAYVRISNNKDTYISFLAAKAKVKPSKPTMTIPRLELQAALLGARLVRHLKSEHDRTFDRLFFWTDSATVWYWIQSKSVRHKQFVANRLSEISELTDVKDWRWLPTKVNVADDATRSGYKSLCTDNRWFTGPGFLYEDESNWPKNKLSPVDDELLEFVGVLSVTQCFELPDVRRFSSWLKLVRSTAWIIRYIRNCSNRRVKGELTTSELNEAECLWIRQTQRKIFPNEYQALVNNKTIDRTSPLRKLSPKLSCDDIIRLNGRLHKLTDGDNWFKFPAILHGNDDYTKLLARHFHVQANHIGHERVINELQQRYWIIKIRPILKRVRRECNTCKLRNAKPGTTIMGQLPTARLTAGMPAFCFTGVDYFGPIIIKIGRRHEKRYGVLFTCLTVRAIHIEIATNLTTDSFIMALRRFTARRGCPQEMYSDNGTNFRGAERELAKNLAELDQNEIQRHLTTHRIKWHFIPPLTPHMGGCWERLVRSVKTTFYAVLKEQYPTDETLSTLMTETEHVINSRPLIDVPLDQDEQEALTPNHFLLGRSSASAPIGTFSKSDLILRKHWRSSQHLADQFWKRWRKEYLPTLNRRTKWLCKGDGVNVGDYVLIVDDNVRRGCWPKGIVTKTFPGDDGKVRVVEVRTATGSYKRPLVRICVLKFSREGNEDPADSNTAGEDVGKIS